ncbi:MAG: hypothetical protein K5777_06725 [Nitrosopumilus sp.]|nr:hypothetical protein [Nitrosopumilus sp.]
MKSLFYGIVIFAILGIMVPTYAVNANAESHIIVCELKWVGQQNLWGIFLCPEKLKNGDIVRAEPFFVSQGVISNVDSKSDRAGTADWCPCPPFRVPFEIKWVWIGQP